MFHARGVLRFSLTPLSFRQSGIVSDRTSRQEKHKHKPLPLKIAQRLLRGQTLESFLLARERRKHLNSRWHHNA